MLVKNIRFHRNQKPKNRLFGTKYSILTCIERIVTTLVAFTKVCNNKSVNQRFLYITKTGLKQYFLGKRTYDSIDTVSLVFCKYLKDLNMFHALLILDYDKKCKTV